MRIITILFILLQLNIPYLMADELNEGDFASGTISTLYGQNINITLPDGKWEVLESIIDGNYRNIELYSDKYETWAYLYVPLGTVSGDYWSDKLEKCSGKDVFLGLVERSNPEASLCFEDQSIDGENWGVVTLNVRYNRPPLRWMSLSFYTPVEKIKTSISNSQFKKVGKKVLKGLRDGFYGKNSTGMAALSELIVSSETESYAETYNDSDFSDTYVSSSSAETNNSDLILGIKDFNRFCKSLDFECDSSLESDYKDYIYAGNYKAWAVTQREYDFNNPAWGYYTRADNLSEARAEALDTCSEYKYESEQCSIILEGNKVVNTLLLAKLNEGTNNNIYAQSDAQTVCLRATTANGMSWENIIGQFGNYVQEAWDRNYSLKFCRSLTKRLPKNESDNSQNDQKTITVDLDLNTDNEAPEILVANEINVESARYTISGTIKDKSKVFVCINENCQLAKGNKFKINRFNPAGEVLEIIAQDEFGNFSTKTVTVNVITDNYSANIYAELNPEKIKDTDNRDRVALIIGIEDYKFSSSASYAGRDALFFTEYLKKMGIKKNKIKTLKDSEAGLIDIYSALEKWLPANINSGSTEVFLFFAGHGLAANNGQDLFLLAHDTDTDMLNRSSLSRTEIFDLISNYNPSHTFVFLDTCYSGASRQGEMLIASARGLVTVEDVQDSIPRNFTIFSAAQGNQIASGLDQVRHGLFSYYAMKGLEGDADLDGNKKISTIELAKYVEKNVRENAAKIGREQIPMMHGDKDIVISNFN